MPYIPYHTAPGIPETGESGVGTVKSKDTDLKPNLLVCGRSGFRPPERILPPYRDLLCCSLLNICS
jgi:hypothetical protein